MTMFFDWYWWLPVACFVYLGATALVAFLRYRRVSLAVFTAAAGLMLLGSLLHLCAKVSIASETTLSAMSMDNQQESARQFQQWAVDSVHLWRTNVWVILRNISYMLGHSTAALAGLVEIVRLIRSTAAALSGLPAARPTSPTTETKRANTPAKKLAMAVSILILLVLFGRLILPFLLSGWLAEMDFGPIDVLACLAIIVVSIVLMILDRRWLALGLGGLLVGLILLFPDPFILF